MAQGARMAFAATTRVAALLATRPDLEFRTEVISDHVTPADALVLLATPADELHDSPSDRVRIAVLTDTLPEFDDPRFDDYVFPSTPWIEVVFRATCALQRKARPRACLSPTSLDVQGHSVPLSVTEHRILSCLLERRGAPVSRADLERVLREAPVDIDAGGGRALDAHVYRLRRKLRGVPGVELATLRQRGFSLSIADAPRDVRDDGSR